MDTWRAVIRILSINALAIAGALVAQFVLWLAGEDSPLLGIYVVLTLALLGVCVWCIGIANAEPGRALLVFGWSAFCIIAAMVILDAVHCPDSLPTLVYAPMVGAAAIGALVGFRQMVLYLSACLIFAISAGLYYDQAAEVGPILIICVAGASVAVAVWEHIEYLSRELARISGMVKKYCNVKKNKSNCD